MSHDITDELLDAISILKFVQVGQCPFLVFKDFVRFLHPDLESANFGFELDQFFLGRVHSFQKLVRIVGNEVITFFELFSLRLQFVEFRGCDEKEDFYEYFLFKSVKRKNDLASYLKERRLQSQPILQ